jgi:hypothetical protein
MYEIEQLLKSSIGTLFQSGSSVRSWASVGNPDVQILTAAQLYKRHARCTQTFKFHAGPPMGSAFYLPAPKEIGRTAQLATFFHHMRLIGSMLE